MKEEDLSSTKDDTAGGADGKQAPAGEKPVSNDVFPEEKAVSTQGLTPLRALDTLVQDKPLFYCCIAVVAVMTLRLIHSVFLHPLRIGWDPALHLQAAQLLIEGKVPYVDMFDVNPPLIWYLDAIPAYFAKVLDFPVTQSFNIFLVAIILYSVSTSLILFFTKAKRSEAPFFLPFLVGLTLFNFFLRWDFGQREEIFVLLYMPFLIVRWLTWQGRGVKSKLYASVIGFIAAIGLCLKPFFLIPAFLVEFYFLLDKQRLKPLFTPEVIACFAGGVLYGLHFLFVPEAMRKSYFEFVIPAFQLGYSFWDTSLAGSFSEPAKRPVFFLMTAACLTAVALRKRFSLMLPMVVFVMAGNIPYLLQFKGWAYHNQPVYAASFILACTEIGFLKILIGKNVHHALERASEKWQRPLLPKKNALLACLVLIASGIALHDGIQDAKAVAEDRKFDMKQIGYNGESPWSDIDTPYTKLVVDNYKLGDKIVFMSNGVAPGYPWLTQLRCAPGSRHLHMVILSVLSYIKDCQPKTEKNIALYKNTDRIIREYAEDIKKNRPLFIFMQKGPDYFDEPYQFVSKYLGDYKELEPIDNFRVFILKEAAK